jgi:hypothetical protein
MNVLEPLFTRLCATKKGKGTRLYLWMLLSLANMVFDTTENSKNETYKKSIASLLANTVAHI